MSLKIAGDDAVRHEETLSLISSLYLKLLSHGFDQNELEIQRTADLNDKDFVCCLTFNVDLTSVEVLVSLIDDSFTADEVQTFLERGVTIMQKTLDLYEASVTVH